MTVTLSVPRLVARSRNFLWFPTLIKLADESLLAVMSNYADEHTDRSTASLSWSSDGGLTWSRPKDGLYGDCPLKSPNGDTLLLPYYLNRKSDDLLSGPYQVIPSGKPEARVMLNGLEVTGWPKKPGYLKDHGGKAEWGLAGFVFNGQTVKLNDGKYLATLYGWFDGDTRYSLVAAESADGIKWQIRSVVASSDCSLPGNEGPCESAICRLADNRLMCIFRLASNVCYGQTFSSDDGRTWSESTNLDGPLSVQPSLACMPGGLVALSGGRPGLFLWLDPTGTGTKWNRVSMIEHHDAHQPHDAIREPGHTSAYTEVVVLDETHLLLIYDRIPNGWSVIGPDSDETNSIWVVRVEVKPTP